MMCSSVPIRPTSSASPPGFWVPCPSMPRCHPFQASMPTFGLVVRRQVDLVGHRRQAQIGWIASRESLADGPVFGTVLDGGDSVPARIGARAESRMDGRGDRGRGSHHRVDERRAFPGETGEVWPRVRPPLEHVSPNAVPNDREDQLGRALPACSSISSSARPSRRGRSTPASSPTVGYTSTVSTGPSTGSSDALMNPGP